MHRSFLDTTPLSKTIKSIHPFSKNEYSVRRNLMEKLDENNPKSNVRELSTISINPLKLKHKEEDINTQLDYIFGETNNLKKEREKNKTFNSCKCAKTNCSKYSCNCLRLGVSCDFLCKCKDCFNTAG
jgi:hypothetical protein